MDQSRHKTRSDESNADTSTDVSLSQLILETAEEGFCLFSADEQRVVAFNPQFALLFDLDPDWLSSEPTAEEVAKAVYDREAHPPGQDLTEYLQRVLERHQKPGEGEVIEVRFADGRVVVGRTQAAPTGERLYTAHDVTHERRMLRELEAERERLSRMVEHAPVAYYVIDCDSGHVLEVSRSIANLTGRPVDAFLGPSDAWRQNIHPDDLDLVRSKRAPSIQRGEAFDIQYRRIHADGQVRWFREMAERIAHSDDRMGETPLQMAGVLIDISEQKDAEHRLKESERRFRDLIEGIPDLVFYEHDPDRRLTYLSPSVHKVLGYAPADLLGERLGDIPSVGEEADLSEAHRFVAEAIRTGRRQPQYEIRVQHKTGKTVMLGISEYPVTGADGEVIKFRGVARDITAVRTMERRLRERERLAILGTFAGGLAHDLNNLLLPIRASLETIERTQNPETVGQRVASIRQATNLIGDLVKKLLFWTRSESMHSGNVTETVVHEWAPHAVQFFRESIRGDDRVPEATIDVSLTIEEAPECAAIDPDLLQQAILNLMLNARDAMPGGGAIRLVISQSPAGWQDEVTDDVRHAADQDRVDAVFNEAAEGEAPGVRFSVIDEGVGMDESIIERAFDPFFSTKGRGKSTGLGLALVRTIVQSAGGQLHTESELSRGTTIHVDIPAVDRVEASPAEGQPIVGRALVQTTDPMIGALVNRAFTQLGFETRSDSSGQLMANESIWVIEGGLFDPNAVANVVARSKQLLVIALREPLSGDQNLAHQVTWLPGPIDVARLRGVVQDHLES